MVCRGLVAVVDMVAAVVGVIPFVERAPRAPTPATRPDETRTRRAAMSDFS